jgi:hypothetical protein
VKEGRCKTSGQDAEYDGSRILELSSEVSKI